MFMKIRLFGAAAALAMAALTVLAPLAGAVPETEGISALAAVVIEADSGRVIMGKNYRTKLPMASTTKIMTALITLESGGLDEEFTADSTAVHTEGSTMGLCEGDIVSKRDLCIGMLLPSGNDAANCAAVRIAGDIPSFARLMNGRAAELGLKNTHFVTPSGLHDDDHYSTAEDMAHLAAYAIKNPDFLQICSKSSMKLSFGDPPYDRYLYNTNKLLDNYEGCIGVKTGFTDEAGRCLVSAAPRNGVTLVCVTLNAPDDWNDHRKMLDYGFSVTERRTVEDNIEYYVSLAGGNTDSLRLVPARTPEYTEIGGEKSLISWRIVSPPMVYAPVACGKEIGTLIVYDGDKEIDRIPMTAAESAPISDALPPRKSIIDTIKDYFKKFWLYFLRK